jgi:hypothetical protein
MTARCRAAAIPQCRLGAPRTAPEIAFPAAATRHRKYPSFGVRRPIDRHPKAHAIRLLPVRIAAGKLQQRALRRLGLGAPVSAAVRRTIRPSAACQYVPARPALMSSQSSRARGGASSSSNLVISCASSSSLVVAPISPCRSVENRQAKKKPGAVQADRASLRELDVLHVCLPHGTPAMPVEVALADHAALRRTAQRDVAHRNGGAGKRRARRTHASQRIGAVGASAVMWWQ